MTGIRFDNGNAARTIDGSFLVPQFLFRVDASAAFDVVNYVHDADTGWYGVQYRISQTAHAGRRGMIFWTLPSSSPDVFMYGNSVKIAGVTTYYVTVMHKAGAYFTPPQGYVFATDYIDQGTERYGMRAWAPNNGPLLFDSGHRHLNMNQICTNLALDTTFDSGLLTPANVETSAYMPIALPGKPAFMLPFSSYAFYANRKYSGYHEGQVASAFRYSGQSFFGKMLRENYAFADDPETTVATFTRVYRDSIYTNLPFAVINAALYD